MDIRFTLLLPRDELSVPVVRHICRDTLIALRVSDTCRNDIEVALTEACTNVLKHAQGHDGDYEVSADITEDRCILRVIDAGAGFDHEAFPFEEAEGVAEAGRGIFLMKALVDDLKFISKPEVGTIVHLEKRLECDDSSVLQRLAGVAPSRHD